MSNMTLNQRCENLERAVEKVVHLVGLARNGSNMDADSQQVFNKISSEMAEIMKKFPQPGTTLEAETAKPKEHSPDSFADSFRTGGSAPETATPASTGRDPLEIPPQA